MAAEGIRQPLLIRLALYLVVAGGILMAVQFLWAAFVAADYRDSTLTVCFLAGLLGCILLAQVASNNAATVRWRGRPDALKVAGAIGGLLAGIWAISVGDRLNTSPKEKAYAAAMKSDLRNLITAEESYFGDNRAYTTTIPATMYTLTTGDAGPTITVQGSDYQAWVSNANTSRTCAIFIGTTAFAPATKEGEPKCT